MDLTMYERIMDKLEEIQEQLDVALNGVDNEDEEIPEEEEKPKINL